MQFRRATHGKDVPYTTSEGLQRYRVRAYRRQGTALLNAKRIEIHGEKAVLGDPEVIISICPDEIVDVSDNFVTS
jgi:hypothetical protein